MMSIRAVLRPIRDLVSSAIGFLYDFYRFARYAGYQNYIHDSEKRDYKAVKIYHRLEKSLSIRNRNPNSGTDAVKSLIELLRRAPKTAGLGFQERVSIKVLNDFLTKQNGNMKNIDRPIIDEEREIEGGVRVVSASQIKSFRLKDPEGFFGSRYSIRDFAPRSIDSEIIKRAVRLALKTPSVCNRQGWFVYHVDDKSKMGQCLSLQNGNAGFGPDIPSLLIIAADLKAFDTAGERYQHWIDGGMFAMSIVYALHSLGVGSCCLNWSKTPWDDILIRRRLPISSHHSIIMMLAVGYPREHLKVCYSARRPMESVYTYWG